MNVKQNIGIVNALIRITVGLTLLSWCTAKLVKQPWRDSYLFVAMCAAMKVAEGIVRYCPVTALMENKQAWMNLGERSDSTGENVDEPPNLDVDLPYNPT